MDKLKVFAIFILLLIVLSGCSISQKKITTELVVSAAISLKEAMEEVEHLYEKTNHIDIQLNLASSGTLSKQIEQGAPVDVFLSANKEEFDKLVENKKIRENSVVHLLKNKLVIISSSSSDIVSFDESMKSDSFAIGLPETVPAGLYAKEALINLGKWDSVEGEIIYAKDVRQVLSYVETGNVQAGIVYKTDVLITDRVNKIFTFDDSLHSAIIYPVGVTESTREIEAANDFSEFLQSEEALNVFEKHGFDLMNEE